MSSPFRSNKSVRDEVIPRTIRASSLPFDRQPIADASVHHLDLPYIEEVYVPAAIDAGRLPKNGRPLYGQMESLGLLMDGKPTRGALLAMGRNPLAWIPGAYVQFLRLQGSGVAGPIKTRKEFTGKLVHVLKHVADLVDVVTQMSVDIASASREIQWYDYPLVAEIMYYWGLAQRVGVGIPIAKQALRDNGNPPLELQASRSSVTVTVRPRPAQ